MTMRAPSGLNDVRNRLITLVPCEGMGTSLAIGVPTRAVPSPGSGDDAPSGLGTTRKPLDPYGLWRTMGTPCPFGVPAPAQSYPEKR